MHAACGIVGLTLCFWAQQCSASGLTMADRKSNACSTKGDLAGFSPLHNLYFPQHTIPVLIHVPNNNYDVIQLH